MKCFCASVAALVTISSAGLAQTTLHPTMATLTSCDHETPVCGVMRHNRSIPYSDECQARAAGATKILFGACSDED